MKRYTGEQLEAAVAAYEEAGTVRAAARALGISKSSLHKRLVAARVASACPEGHEAARVSTRLDRAGNPVAHSVTTRPARGEVHKIPEGHALKRISALVDADGRVVQKWVISSPEGERLADYAAALRQELGDAERLAPIEAPGYTDDEHLALYPIADQHHGLYAWAPEAGDSYDLGHSERLLKEQLSRTVALMPPARKAVILGLGDFFHTDGHVAQTVESRNPLDRDGRQAKVTRSGIRLLRWAIDLALTRHELVHVTIRAGNHDPMSALWLSECLAIAYENEPRVQVDLDPSLFWFATFGRVLIAATHGHTCKPSDFAAKMAAAVGEAWGASDFRFGWQGHIHHETKIERGGAIVETLQTLSAKDAWHSGRPYDAGRSTIGVLYHRELGEVLRVKSPVAPDRTAARRRVVAL